MVKLSIACTSSSIVGHNGKQNNGTTNIGGLIGDNSYDSLLQSCYFIGDIDAPFGAGEGTLIGTIHHNGIIRKCFWEGGVTHIGHPFQPNTIEDNGRVPEKLSWQEATEKLNEGIQDWNNSNTDNLCNFEFVQQEGILSIPILTSKA